MNRIILHHYPASPVSEKVRTGLGLKQLTWHSVEQNRLPDRPELFAMTGGYRRIPVMQIGADMYCDTQCIFSELEKRFPEPTFFPNQGSGLPFALSRWTDGPLFDLALRVAFAPVAESLPPALVSDRARLYLGPTGNFAEEAEDLPHTLAQLRPQLGWLEKRFETGRSYVLGDAPGLPDLLAWFIVWFISERYASAEEFLSEFPLLNAWAVRMKAVGHGYPTPMSPKDALDIAKDALPVGEEQSDSRDPQGIQPGMNACISPVTDSGEKPIKGQVRSVSKETVSLTINNNQCGEMAVHFPRVGYRLTLID